VLGPIRLEAFPEDLQGCQAATRRFWRHSITYSGPAGHAARDVVAHVRFGDIGNSACTIDSYGEPRPRAPGAPGTRSVGGLTAVSALRSRSGGSRACLGTIPSLGARGKHRIWADTGLLTP
jgi:hypothetical protein